MEESWDAVLTQAIRCLRRACEDFAEKLERDEAGLKELRELTAAIRELAALQRQLNPDEAAESVAVEVSFDDEGDVWSR